MSQAMPLTQAVTETELQLSQIEIRRQILINKMKALEILQSVKYSQYDLERNKRKDLFDVYHELRVKNLVLMKDFDEKDKTGLKLAIVGKKYFLLSPILTKSGNHRF